jgi:hypothetical protein
MAICTGCALWDDIHSIHDCPYEVSDSVGKCICIKCEKQFTPVNASRMSCPRCASTNSIFIMKDIKGVDIGLLKRYFREDEDGSVSITLDDNMPKTITAPVRTTVVAPTHNMHQRHMCAPSYANALGHHTPMNHKLRAICRPSVRGYTWQASLVPMPR